MSAEFQIIEVEIPEELAGYRLDVALARLLPEHSRTRIRGWIDAGQASLGRLPLKPRDRVSGGARVLLRIAAPSQVVEAQAERMPLEVVFEDDDVRVINKPAGLVVHPGAGNPRHTLQNALLGLDPSAGKLPRAGIIHRLDKDTSGLLIIARTERALTDLGRQLMARSVTREYLAICVGTLTGGGTVDEPIGRHRTDRVRMAVRRDGRPATTHYRVIERFRAHTYVRVRLETGRTHQIRLHFAHLHHPLIGDPVYGGRLARPRGAGDELIEVLRGFKRQALHAATLGFDHPGTGRRLEFTTPPPGDFKGLLGALRGDAAAARPAGT
jgi:23S rRNA pseudouridine1911/1915/1917 synthase